MPEKNETTEIVHELKTWLGPFEAIRTGDKRHEVRKDDRGFKCGDTLRLREWNEAYYKYTGREISVRVTHITVGGAWGLPSDLCVMSIEPADSRSPSHQQEDAEGEHSATVQHAINYLRDHQAVKLADELKAAFDSRSPPPTEVEALREVADLADAIANRRGCRVGDEPHSGEWVSVPVWCPHLVSLMNALTRLEISRLTPNGQGGEG